MGETHAWQSFENYRFFHSRFIDFFIVFEYAKA